MDYTVQGTGEQLLPDKWFSVRYYAPKPGAPNCKIISDWTPPMLYEGYVKRVTKKINLFDQKVKNFHSTDIDTLASMISLAGKEYAGDIALSDNPEYLQNLGIIQVYETLLNRALNLATGNNADVNKAILLAANRLAQLYLLLGNEAYGDAADPTIGFSTSSGQVGSEASSVFCFENQVDSLLEEELALLRGRADKGVQPMYNRLVWNFTNGFGEVAYKENYNITDQETLDENNDTIADTRDGIINEKDAMVQYPMGHGDAWGHYLSAIRYYYDLIRNQNFTWTPHSEVILVDQLPVSVDFRDERTFASAAAARARTGAEIVNLTYRQKYTDDPDGQWQGYRDSDKTQSLGCKRMGKPRGTGCIS